MAGLVGVARGLGRVTRGLGTVPMASEQAAVRPAGSGGVPGSRGEMGTYITEAHGAAASNERRASLREGGAGLASAA